MTPMYCSRCGTVGEPAREIPGSFALELLLWLLFILPGLIYSVWRLCSAKDACIRCGDPRLIPADSPLAVHLLAQHPSGPVVRAPSQTRLALLTGFAVVLLVIVLPFAIALWMGRND